MFISKLFASFTQTWYAYTNKHIIMKLCLLPKYMFLQKCCHLKQIINHNVQRLDGSVFLYSRSIFLSKLFFCDLFLNEFRPWTQTTFDKRMTGALRVLSLWTRSHESFPYLLNGGMCPNSTSPPTLQRDELMIIMPVFPSTLASRPQLVVLSKRLWGTVWGESIVDASLFEKSFSLSQPHSASEANQVWTFSHSVHQKFWWRVHNNYLIAEVLSFICRAQTICNCLKTLFLQSVLVG